MKVTIICGPPASGKTTYVKNNMQIGDLVVDLDAIRCAIGFTEKDQQTESLLSAARQVRDFLYSLIENNQIDVEQCWIIACLPCSEDRELLQKRFNAKLICMNVSEEECIYRAMHDPERINKGRQIEIIQEWFAKAKEKVDPIGATRALARYFSDIED